jgi:hypothetical protein
MKTVVSVSWIVWYSAKTAVLLPVAEHLIASLLLSALQHWKQDFGLLPGEHLLGHTSVACRTGQVLYNELFNKLLSC